MEVWAEISCVITADVVVLKLEVTREVGGCDPNLQAELDGEKRGEVERLGGSPEGFVSVEAWVIKRCQDLLWQVSLCCC